MYKRHITVHVYFSFLDAPVLGSLPHFYMGNKSLWRAVEGLHPQKYVHGTFLDIEPVSVFSIWS